jgi:hypothetical protein
MTPWIIEFTNEAKKDRAALDRAQRVQVNKAILLLWQLVLMMRSTT